MPEFNVDPVGTAFMCLLYIVVGSISVLCNMVNLAVFFSTKEFRQKYFLFIVLDFGELINAVAYIATGLGRLLALYNGSLQEPHTVEQCFFDYPWPVLLILGMQLTAITIVTLSLERIGAILAPILFKTLFLTDIKWFIFSVIPSYSLISLGVAAYSTISDSGETSSTGHCGIITSTPTWYSTFHFVFIVIAYMVSFWSSFLVWYRFRDRSSSSRKLFVNVVIIGVSALLVSIPSTVNILIKFGVMDLNDLPYSIIYSLPGFLSIANTVVSFSLRPDVRRQFQVVCLKKQISHYRDSTSTPPQTTGHPTATNDARHTFLHHN